jgi:RNA polymerase sigma-70 factor (ECF subfamily)
MPVLRPDDSAEDGRRDGGDWDGDPSERSHWSSDQEGSMTTSTIDRARAGDRQALAELVLAERSTIARALLRFRLSPADRDDLVQAVTLRILEKLPTFVGGSSISTWVFRIARNEAVDFLRSRARWRSSEPAPSSEEGESAAPLLMSKDALPDAALIAAEEGARVAEAVAALPADMRQAVEAHYGAGRPLDDLAAELGVEPTTVRTRLHRARQRVRESLG